MTTHTVSPEAAANDAALKARHAAMWALGDYPAVARDVIPELGRVLVEACRVTPGQEVLDVAAGSGNASIPAAKRGASVTAGDLAPELLEAGRARAEAEGVKLDWVEADAERLPFEDESFDAVISSLGAMFAPRHAVAAAELVRVCRPGGTIGLLSWTPEGMVGALFRTMKPFAPPPPPGAQPPPLWGSEEHLRELFGERVAFRSMERDTLDVTAFERPEDFAADFRTNYGPTLVAEAHARKAGREAELHAELDRLVVDWDRGTNGRARFELEYLVAVATRL
jgi:SAM-dependent methyltransferase